MIRTFIIASVVFSSLDVVAQNTIIFFDDFKTNSNNWMIVKNATATTSFGAKGYSIQNKSNSNEIVYQQLPIDRRHDYSIELTITRDFKKENYGYGICFGGKDPGNIYEFFIEASGSYTFYKYEGHEYKGIIEWTAAPGIQDVGQPNTIKVSQRSGTLHFFINGSEVNTYRNFVSLGNLFGIGVGPNSKVTARSMKVTYTPESSPVVRLDTAALPNKVILDEHFIDNRMRWDYHEGYCQIKDGCYELANPLSNDSYLFWEDYSMFKVHDFSVETELELINGIHYDPYGLLIGMKGGAGDYVEFAITNNGFIRLSQNTNWESETLVNWQFSSSIKSNAPNTLLAQRKNDSLYFYVNKQLVLTYPMIELAGNGVGWILSNGIKKLNVKYIRIRQPSQQLALATDQGEVSQREQLGSAVNSLSEEFSPVISPDGSTLYFTRDDNPGIGKLEKDDIWHSVMNSNAWSPCIKMPAPLNNEFDCSVVSVSTDNQTLLLRGNYEASDSVEASRGLFMSHNGRQGWGRPERVNIDEYTNHSNEEDFRLSSDKKILLSSIENEQSLGERDLYVSFLQDNNIWSKPLNLGKVVNTTSEDFSPFLATDNMTLYYSSFGMPSFGKADIYVTRRLDDTWQNWSPPQNLGSGINTELIDEGFTLAANGTEAFLSSEKNTIGKADIFKVKLPPLLQPNPVVLIYGKVYDMSTKQTIGTDIIYEDLETDTELGKAFSHEKTGEYKIILPYGEHYGLNANLDGYLPLHENVDIVEKKNYQEIQVDLFLMPIRAGEHLVINNLFFAPGRALIAMKSYPELRKVIEVLKKYQTMRITIAGHTDDGAGRESKGYLRKLSEKRADAVKNYFMQHGISEDRINTIGFGMDKPLAANDSEEGRAKNRRVEFIIDSL
jgi:outer membrane protein OmpA-like peptidoglycan-associated protein